MNKYFFVVGLALILLGSSVPVEAIQLGGKGNKNISDSDWGYNGDYLYMGFSSTDKKNKKVGVGTLTPEKDFEVIGEAQFEDVYIKNDTPSLTFNSVGVVSGIISSQVGVMDVLAGVGRMLAFGSNNIMKRFFLDIAGNVGIGVESVAPGLKLGVGGKVGAVEYCDENGANCKSIKELGTTGGVFSGGDLNIGDCGLSAVFTSENGNVSSNKGWSFGKGQTTYGSLMGCDGAVTKLGVICSGKVGTSLAVYVYKNNVKTDCVVSVPAVSGKSVVGDCSVSFVGTDVLNIGTGTEVGKWEDCVGSFWVRYK